MVSCELRTCAPLVWIEYWQAFGIGGVDDDWVSSQERRPKARRRHDSPSPSAFSNVEGPDIASAGLGPLHGSVGATTDEDELSDYLPLDCDFLMLLLPYDSLETLQVTASIVTSLCRSITVSINGN